jgi:hypothetical protein
MEILLKKKAGMDNFGRIIQWMDMFNILEKM